MTPHPLFAFLREVVVSDSIREVIALHTPIGQMGVCPTCQAPGKPGVRQAAPCTTVRVVGSGYDTHPKYQPEWMPR